MKVNLKAWFLIVLAVILANRAGVVLTNPGIGFKILGGMLILLGAISAGVGLHLLGFNKD